MPSMDSLLSALNLIYYEHDPKAKMLRLDPNAPKDHAYSERIKITHLLSRHRINYFLDEAHAIVLEGDNTLLEKLKRRITSFFTTLGYARKHVYILSDKKVKWAKNLPVFEIKPKNALIEFSRYDAIIFTSKNAVHALQAVAPHWKKLPCYVIAPQTAKAVKQYGAKVKFVGKAKHGDAFAQELLGVLAQERVLYVRGKKTVSSIASILQTHGITCDETIIYETVCKEQLDITLPKGAKIIFSSPSTIECFLKHLHWDESFQAIAIGKTTARYFPPHITPIIADTTSLESCVKKALEL